MSAESGQQSRSIGDASYTFEQNFPTEEAARRARDEGDFQRAIIAYRFWFPTITFEAIFEGLSESGVFENQSCRDLRVQAAPRLPHAEPRRGVDVCSVGFA